MGVRRGPAASAWTGLLLVVAGLLSVAVSTFLLPLVDFDCFDTCGAPTYSTAWQISMRALSGSAPAAAPFVLLLCLLPLLAAATTVGCGIGSLLRPRRTFATWSVRAWRAGVGALVILLPFLFFFVRPEIGYVGLLVGYGLWWGGSRLLRTRQP